MTTTKSSQEEYQRILTLKCEQEKIEAIRLFDWDANFDYDRYPKQLLKDCRKYPVYMGSDVWIDKRAIRIMIDGFRCRSCGAMPPECTLSVDHCWTSYQKIPYESIWFDLTTLCWGRSDSCHEAITNLEHKRKNDKVVVEVAPHQVSIPRIGERHERTQEITLSPHRDRPHYFSQRTIGGPQK